ncbi:MAG TPA: DEAD/DEAH box helicase, partial [Chitinophagaceae bacterium]|nr:DEAD/DEAH box helicase [Chitinophagaceae bacterium]
MSFPIDHNPIFQFAADCINYSNRSVFLTGKAGTGKTTFLKYIKENVQKEAAVLAPTGVAAINAGGVTIHSFFQLPFGPFVPGTLNNFNNSNRDITDKHHLLGRLRYNKERIQLLQNLELLIIDEISMVRCDVLDAIDIILKHFRYRHNEPFGGVQVLLIGDMYQLPPVARDEEWSILSAFYNSSYFFDSLVMQQQPPLHIELEKIYRQSDPQFISLLNKVRNNEMDQDAVQILRSRYKPGFQSQKEQGYITLATHNYLADNINAEELQKLPGNLFGFKAKIEGEFSEKSYPAEELLQLKQGAQVMYLKNDMEKVRRFFNGKIGIVQKIEDDKIFVQCANEKPIEVQKYKWENIRYSINKTTQKLEEEVIGSFEQYPLRLAWAITIHKSQGLTFEKAVIDAGAAFTSGQVYVALSRCTSLDGMILRSFITQNALFTDTHINRFANSRKSFDQLPNELQEAKHHYQQSILISLFDFSRIVKMNEQFLKNTEEHKSSFNEETIPWLQNIVCKTEVLQTVAQKFQPQLEQLAQQQQLPEENVILQQRIKAAAQYFSKELQQLLQVLSKSPAVTDSRQFATDYNEDLKNIHVVVANKLHLINSCINGFTVLNYHKQKN